ncbi:PHP domain-containing protein [Thermanaerovibrio acidaminovorans]|uniref:PHP domain-containing protein n=1 Tax=Thermanaerovibrio acidaminovorans TaxID=81462 RepID=UPI002490073D|nr:PHP domain-containing protein [Thermanaerovibrio acidaminovorans]
MILVDLHLHSTFSDGTLTPHELVRLGRRSGLSVMALTDHDTMDGNGEFLAACTSQGVKGIPGVEVSGEAPYTLHILGYRVSPTGPLSDALVWIRQGREERNFKICDRLSDLGCPVDMEEVRAEAGSDLVGRPHIAKVMLRKGYVGDYYEAFHRFLKRGAPAYFPRPRLSPADAVRLIRESGGLPVMAHPMQTQLGWDDLYGLVRDLRSFGLWGVECLHPTAGILDRVELIRVTRELGLVPTGGSDFHGDNKPGISMGVSMEATAIPWARLGISL